MEPQRAQGVLGSIGTETAFSPKPAPMERIDRGAVYRSAVAAAQEPVAETHGRARDAATRRGARRAILAVGAGAVVVAAAIGVRGDFPLSDDWSYAFAVRELWRTGSLRLLPWTGASLVLQAWYGAALCALAGFSFTWLRASTVVLATGGAVGFHLLLRHAGVRGGALALGTVLFALNPLYVNLAFTFMTDVPFAVAAVWAGYAYVRGLGERRTDLLLWGGLAAAGAILIRQHGIFVAAAAALAALLAADRAPAARLRDGAAAALLPALVFVAFHVWLFAVQGAPAGYANKLGEAERLSLAGLANCAFRGLAYLGLFLCPLAPGLAPALAARHGRLLGAWCALLAALAFGLYVRDGALMFYLTNVLHDFGVGALTLRDTLFLGLPPPVRFGRALTVPLTIVAAGTAGLLAAVWTAGLARVRTPVPAFLLLATGLLFAGTLLHTRYYFDRYLVAVLPFALAATLALWPVARTRPLGAVLAACLAWYAVAGTHDYLAWNRARFAGLDALAAAGVPASAIDGGVEFNAWHLAPTLDRWPSDDEVRVGQPATRRSWWWVVDDRYVVSFRPLTGYAVRQEVTFARWLVPGTGHVLILERREDGKDAGGRER